MYDLIIKNTKYLDENIEVQENKNIAIKNGKLFFIEKELEAKKIIDGKALLWMPGLVDGHIHTSQQLLRGRLLDEKPVIWKRINVPYENGISDKLLKLSVKLASLEMIKNGTTSFVDIGTKKADLVASQYLETGLRGQLSCFANDSKFAPDNLRSNSTKELLIKYEQLKDILKESNLLNPFLSITSPSVVSEDFMITLIEKAIDDDVPFSTHLNEYSSEVFDFIEKYKERPFEYFNNRGLIGNKFIAAHCLMLSQKEHQIIRERDVKVIHCPFSNSGKGVPETHQLLANGVSVGFGSDGAGHGGLDLFKEIRTFRCIMNATKGISEADPQIMSAKTLLKMATKGSSNALFDDELGLLKEGNKADLIAIDIKKPHIFPTSNLVNTIVESVSGSDVVNMIVDGKIIMEDRKVLTIDENEVLNEIEEIDEYLSL